jgi:hypothetical protein
MSSFAKTETGNADASEGHDLSAVTVRPSTVTRPRWHSLLQGLRGPGTKGPESRSPLAPAGVASELRYRWNGSLSDKGKPVARLGRKATGQAVVA